MITLKEAELVQVALPLVRPFRTSFGVQETREAVLLRVVADVDGNESTGWGECVTGSEPFYSSEWSDGAWILLRDLLLPMVTHAHINDLDEIPGAIRSVRGNPMAKATVEMALIDAVLRARSMSLQTWLGGTRERVACGVSIGIAVSIDALLEQIEGYLADGYQRIKLKIEPGSDIEIVAAVRARFPHIMLTVDANAAYSPVDAGHSAALRALDEHSLTLIEQPFAEDDLASHAALAATMTTPICLDESITSTARAIEAIDMKACSIVNIKQGRMGGLIEANATQAACGARGIPVWCGGMLETGIGRAANLALASLDTFTLPGDTSASRRYFRDDITEPFEMSADGTIEVPRGPGLGVTPLPEMLASLTVRTEQVPL